MAKKRPKAVHTTSKQLLTQLEAHASAILAEGAVLSSFKHRGLSGIEREEPVRRFLRTHLPGRFHVGQGSIASSEAILEHQHDIIVADRDICFLLLNTLSAQLMAIESVHLIVEVRSRDNELDDVAASLSAVRGLRANQGLRQLGGGESQLGTTGPPVHTIVFYQGPKNPATLLKKVVEANRRSSDPAGRMPIDFVLVLGTGKDSTPSSGYLLGYSRFDKKLQREFRHHYYPQGGQDGLDGPKLLVQGSCSFAHWYAGLLNHLSGVIAYPPILYSYLGEKYEFFEWTDCPH